MFISSCENVYCPTSIFVVFGIKTAMKSITEVKIYKAAENPRSPTNAMIRHI
jgi:hypothetical protein